MGRMSDLDIERQEEQDQFDCDMDNAIEQSIAENEAIDLDLKQIVIDAHNKMMANAKQMDKQMEKDDAK